MIVVDGLRQHAIKLIAQYAAVRKNLEEVETSVGRLTIWVCHDLGDNSCINLEEYPDLSRDQSKDELAQEFRIALNSLIERRAMYKKFQLLIESQLNKCYDFPYLGHFILSWLSHHVRGAPKDEIPNIISKLSHMTAENTVNVFISSLKPECRRGAKNVFNWIKHAAEPWTPASLAEMIAVYECGGKDVCLDDIDSSEFMGDIEKKFRGMITV
ncbi:hypothetical protein ACQKWADRAFT_316852 [Trichoderma austrokoningii]